MLAGPVESPARLSTAEVPAVASTAKAELEPSANANDSANSSCSTSSHIHDPCLELDPRREQETVESLHPSSELHPNTGEAAQRDEVRARTIAGASASAGDIPASPPRDVFVQLTATDVWMCGLVFVEILSLTQLGNERWQKFVDIAQANRDATAQETAVSSLTSWMKQILCAARDRQPLFEPATDFGNGYDEWCAAGPL